MILKKGVVALLLSLALLSGSTHGSPRLALSPSGCQLVAQAVGLAAHRAQEKDFNGALIDLDKREVPHVFIEHLRLLEVVVRSHPTVSPQDHYEGYLEFCMENSGEFDIMNEHIKQMIGEKVAFSL